MARYSLGSLDFMFFHGLSGPQESPQLLEHVKTIHSRPGVDGVSVKKQGEKGTPFPMYSIKDEESLQGALDEYDLYKQASESGGPASIKWENGDWSGLYATEYVVLEVSRPRIRKVSPMTASAVKTTTNPAWTLEVIWTLIPVAQQQA